MAAMADRPVWAGKYPGETRKPDIKHEAVWQFDALYQVFWRFEQMKVFLKEFLQVLEYLVMKNIYCDSVIDIIPV